MPSQEASPQSRMRAQHYAGRTSEPRILTLDHSRPRLRDQDAPMPAKIDRKVSLYSQENAMWSQVAVAGFPLDHAGKRSEEPRTKQDQLRTPPRKRTGSKSTISTSGGPGVNAFAQSKSSSASAVKHVRFALPVTEEDEGSPPNHGGRPSRPPQQRSQTAPSRIESVDAFVARVDPIMGRPDPAMSLRDWIYQPVVSPTSSVVSTVAPTATSHSIPGTHASPGPEASVHGSMGSFVNTTQDKKPPTVNPRARRFDMEAAYACSAPQPGHQRPKDGQGDALPLLDAYAGVYGWPDRRADSGWRAAMNGPVMDLPAAMDLHLNSHPGMSGRRRSAV